MMDDLSLEKIKAGLKTKIFGQNLQIFSSIPTTMDTLKALALTGAPEGTIVIADTQIQGRGRHGRTWFSPPGKNIYCSILFRPNLAPEETQRLLCLALVASHHTILEKYGISALVKWPNDLIINGKKVAGFLLQNELKTDKLEFSILGVGLNINMDKKDLSPDLVGLASSPYMVTGRVVSRSELIASLLNKIEYWYNILNEEGFYKIREDWIRLWGQFNKTLKIRQPGRTIQGIGKGLDDCGYVILELENGKWETIYVGDPV